MIQIQFARGLQLVPYLVIPNTKNLTGRRPSSLALDTRVCRLSQLDYCDHDQTENLIPFLSRV